jgi:hypothetical protein
MKIKNNLLNYQLILNLNEEGSLTKMKQKRNNETKK